MYIYIYIYIYYFSHDLFSLNEYLDIEISTIMSNVYPLIFTYFILIYRYRDYGSKTIFTDILYILK